MRILVTGGSGFLGCEMVRRLTFRGDTVVAFDTHVSSELRQLITPDGSVVAEVGDITDMSNVCQVFKAHSPEAVLHLAAIVGVPASLGTPANVVRANIQGSLNVFDAMRLYGVRRIIHMSTEEVYGDFRGPVAHEDDFATPLMAYGITKLAVEHFGRSYREVHGIDCINLRTSWVYGVRLDRPRPPMSYMNAAMAGRPLHVPKGADVITDYTHIEDLTDAILAALNHPIHKYDVYNIGSGEAISEGELVEIVRTLVPGADISVGPGRREFAPGVRIPLKGALDISRAKSEFGYSPRFDIRSGLEAYAAEWRRAMGVRNARI